MFVLRVLLRWRREKEGCGPRLKCGGGKEKQIVRSLEILGEGGCKMGRLLPLKRICVPNAVRLISISVPFWYSFY
jgi:hypothetical protein